MGDVRLLAYINAIESEPSLSPALSKDLVIGALQILALPLPGGEAHGAGCSHLCACRFALHLTYSVPWEAALCGSCISSSLAPWLLLDLANERGIGRRSEGERSKHFWK